ncbi:MAG: hypothetical protein LUC44_04340 [Prevotellaceae bacterium]|nr:hypothetical protein [Prevotellaceae bacterium]
MKDERDFNVTDDSTLFYQPAGNAAAASPLAGDVLGEEASAGDAVWKKVVLGTGAGIVLGSAGAFLVSGKGADAAEVAPDAAAEAEAQPTVMIDNAVPMASGVSDAMSFSQAFAAARGEVGSGGVFEWHGRLYNTFTVEEWDSMTAQERADFEGHFDWSAAQSHPAAEPSAPAHETVEAPEEASVQAVPVDEPEAVVAEPDQVDVQVLGVYHSPQLDANLGGALIDGHEVLFIDADKDETFDYVAADFNGDGQLTEDEVIDISDQHITVDDMGGFSDPADHFYSDDSASVSPDDLNMYDV